MSNYIKAHGITLATGGSLENAVVETLTVAPAELTAGRFYYDSTDGDVKYITTVEGSLVVRTIGSSENQEALETELASLAGAATVGITGVTGTEGKFSVLDGDVQDAVDQIVQGIDVEIKNREDAITAEASARTTADSAINDTINAMKADGGRGQTYDGTTTVVDLVATDVAQAGRLDTLEDKVDGDMGEFGDLENLVDYGSGATAPVTLVDAINAVNQDLTSEISRATTLEGSFGSLNASNTGIDLVSAINFLEDNTGANFLDKTTTDAQIITANSTFSSNVTITGDLTVNGGNFVTEAEVVTFADNILTLNSNVTTGVPTESAGLEVSRGDEGTLSIITWNETSTLVEVPVDNAGTISQEEVATKPYTEANFQTINDALAAGNTALQTELDSVQTASGLEDDGTYVADPASNYANTATSLKNADKKIDAQVKVNTDGLAQEVTDRTDADTALDGRVTTVEAQVNGKIGDLATLSNLDNVTGLVAENIVDAINDVDADLTQEISDRTAGDATLAGVITALKDTSISTIKDLDNAISANNTAINTEISDRQAAITAEITARTDADSALSSQLSALKDGSILTVQDLDDAVQAEETRATGAEGVIDTTIATLKTEIEAMYYTFTADNAGTTFNIGHNLNSEFVSVQVWVYDTDTLKWKNDIVAIEIVDNANINIYLTESRKVKVIVSKIATLS